MDRDGEKKEPNLAKCKGKPSGTGERRSQAIVRVVKVVGTGGYATHRRRMTLANIPPPARRPARVTRRINATTFAGNLGKPLIGQAQHHPIKSSTNIHENPALIILAPLQAGNDCAAKETTIKERSSGTQKSATMTLKAAVAAADSRRKKNSWSRLKILV